MAVIKATGKKGTMGYSQYKVTFILSNSSKKTTTIYAIDLEDAKRLTDGMEEVLCNAVAEQLRHTNPEKLVEIEVSLIEDFGRSIRRLRKW